ncbi:FAD-binding oxidoreductase, partial [Burkholderia pseudomallei]
GMSLFLPELWARSEKFRFHLTGAAWRDLMARAAGGAAVLEPRDPNPQPNPAHAPSALSKLKAVFRALGVARIFEALG